MQSRAEGNTANQPHSKQSLDDDFEASIPQEKSLIAFSEAFLLCVHRLWKSRKYMLIIADRISKLYLIFWTQVVND